MQIILLSLGKTTEPWVKQGVEIYAARLAHYTQFKLHELPEVKAGSKPVELVLQAEAAQIQKFLMPGDMLILLDENGAQHSSRALANTLQKWMNASPKRIVFVVGGAFGFSQELKKVAQQTLSLSKLTFTHQMIRVFFVEQLYRAFTILKGEHYHND